MTISPNKKDLYSGYAKEAVSNLRDQDLLKLRLKEIKDAVKESEFDVKEFNQVVKAVYDLEKVQEQVDSLQRSIDTVEELGL